MAKKAKSKNFVDRFGAYGVGALAALGALILAVLLPENREMIIGAAGTLALLTFFFTSENDSWGFRLIGVLAAGVTVLFSFLMPEFAPTLLKAGGLIAGASIVFK